MLFEDEDVESFIDDNSKKLPKNIEITHMNISILVDGLATDFTDEQCDQLRQDWFEKPDIHLVRKQLRSIKNKQTNIGLITRYYLKHIMSNVIVYNTKWSVTELLQSNDLIRYLIFKIRQSPNVFAGSDLENFDTMLRIGFSGISRKITNFAIDTVDRILQEYNVNDNYYDFSCGWGVRMMGSMRNNINYFGTDPNHALVEQLALIKQEYDLVNNTKASVDIRCQGSEYFIPEWENKMGIAFSSPPYFALEDYRIGDLQSYKEGETSYDSWLNDYCRGTIKNIKRYLIVEGYLLLNIKAYGKFDLYNDVKKIIYEEGFIFVDDIPLKLITRPNGKQVSEQIMVFKKTEKTLTKHINEFIG
jgi:hypothetical protein